MSTFIAKSPFPDVPAGPYPLVPDLVMEHWSSWGAKLAVRDGVTNDERSYEMLFADVHAVSHGLSDMGIGLGDCVGMFSCNHVDYITVGMAVQKVGASISPANPLYTAKELTFQLEKSGAKALVVHPDFLPVAEEALRNTPNVKTVIVLGDVAPEGMHTFDSMRATSGSASSASSSSSSELFATASGLTPDSLSTLPFSSGTTGLPKGTMITHGNLAVNLHQCYAGEGEYLGQDDTLISPLPMFHIYAYTLSMLYTMWKGSTLVTMQRFDLDRFCELVQETGASRAHLVPPIILGLAKSDIPDKYDLSSMKMAISAAAPLGADVEADCIKKRGFHIKQAWGMSELSPLGTMTPDNDLRVGAGSIGVACASTEAKIVDVETREDLPIGKGPNGEAEAEGELLIRGPQVMLGYLGEPDKTADTITGDGWLLTGDIAKIDDDGYIYITDRLKELIKYKGFQVAPAELEDVLCTHPDVVDATCIPSECEEAGEVPRAYVVLSKEGALTEQQVQDYVAERVAPHKRLRGGVVFTDAIPKTASGKILRRVVVEQDRAARKQAAEAQA